MNRPRFPDDLVIRGAEGSMVLVVLDGVGGLPDRGTGQTELEAAWTPNLDALAREASLGMLVPVAPGVTAGSGPGHLGLFGYDPIEHIVGRGLLSALGVGFELEPGDVAARLNLATLDEEGRVVDRRADRPSDEVGRQVVQRLRETVSLGDGVEWFLQHEKEHRAVLVLRGSGLAAAISDTDPQEVGVPPLPPNALDEASKKTADLVAHFLAQARETLRAEGPVTGLLARGFARHDGFPSFEQRFDLEAHAYARYPMYRGVARLVGMAIPGVPASDDEAVGLLETHFEEADFHFIHFKAPDARGEDRDFAAKVKAIEAIDALIPRIAALKPAVVAVTGDHSTPAAMGSHSWHHVPLLLASRWARPTGTGFSESACRGGDVGVVESRHLMSLMLAHADRLAKFGA